MTGISKEVQERLIAAADKVRENAYAPYSGYRVGAAFLMADGSIEVGCNVENASYGLAICAERTAFVSAIAKGKKDFVAGAVIVSSDQVGAPCGACRQFMSEFNGSLPLILATDKGKVKVTNLGELLPMQFDRSYLP